MHACARRAFLFILPLPSVAMRPSGRRRGRFLYMIVLFNYMGCTWYRLAATVQLSNTPQHSYRCVVYNNLNAWTHSGTPWRFNVG